MLTSLPVTGFLDVLASEAPAPGGGSVSALSGALAAGLLDMVCRLSLNRPELQERTPVFQELSGKLQTLRAELVALLEEDTEAFNEVMRAFKLPKATDEEKAGRSAAIQTAYAHAVAVPLRTAECCVSVAECGVALVDGFNRNAASDLGVAVECARAGMRGALLNVDINLPSIKNAELVATTRQRVQELEQLMHVSIERITPKLNN